MVVTEPAIIWRLDDNSARWSLRRGLHGRALVGTLPGVPGLRVLVGPADQESAADGRPWRWMLYVHGRPVRGNGCERKRDAKLDGEQAIRGAAAAQRAVAA